MATVPYQPRDAISDDRIAALEDRFDKTAIEFANRIAALEQTDNRWDSQLEKRVAAVERMIVGEGSASVMLIKDFHKRVTALESDWTTLQRRIHQLEENDKADHSGVAIDHGLSLEDCDQRISATVARVIELEKDVWKKITRYGERIATLEHTWNPEWDKKIEDRIGALEKAEQRIAPEFEKRLAQHLAGLEQRIASLEGRWKEFLNSDAPRAEWEDKINGRVCAIEDSIPFFPILENRLKDEAQRIETILSFLRLLYPTFEAHLEKATE